MHTIQASKSRHNIFSDTDHDRKHIEAASTKKKKDKDKNQSSSTLPDIDLNVRQKLATTDLHVKFAHKSKVLTVASTFKKENSEFLDGDTLGMDEEDMRSTKSQYSETLEVMKRNMMNDAASPLPSPHRLPALSPAGPTPRLEEHLDEDHMQHIDEYDDEDHGKFGSTVEEHEFSKTDAKRYKTALDAHKSFMDEAKSKNTMKYIKKVASAKFLPSTEMIEETKKARNQLETTPVKSPGPNSPLKSPNLLKPLTSSFLFLTALTKGQVPKLASALSPSTAAEEKPNVFDNDDEYDQDNFSYANPPNESMKSFGQQSVFTTGTATLVGDPSKRSVASTDKHYTAPIDSNSPVLRPALSTKTFSRFSNSKSPVVALRHVKSFDQKRTSPTQVQDIQDAAADEVYYGGEGEEKSMLSGSIGYQDDSKSDMASQIKKIFEHDPTKEHRYEIPQLNALKSDKAAMLQKFDNAVTNLTFVKAPEKPKPPVAKKPDPLTLKTVFGNGELIEANIPSGEHIDDDEYNKLVFGGDPPPEKTDDDDNFMPFQVLTKENLKKTGEKKSPIPLSSNTASPSSSKKKKEAPNPSSPEEPISSKENLVLPFTNSRASSFQPLPSVASSGKDLLPDPSDPLLNPDSYKLLQSVKGSDRFQMHSKQHSTMSMESTYSYCTMTSSKDGLNVPGFRSQAGLDPRLPPLDFSLLNQPYVVGGGGGGSIVNSSTANSVGSTAMIDPPQRRRSFLNLPNIAQNSYGVIRASFLKNFANPNQGIIRKGNNLSSDSNDNPSTSPIPGGTLHDYTKALSHSTQNFIANIAKQFSRSRDSYNPTIGKSRDNLNINTSTTPGLDERPIFPSEDFYSPSKYYIPLNEKDDDLDSFHNSTPKQPLNDDKQDFIYQHSTNSYVPKDYVNQSSFGFHHRGDINHVKHDLFSERHLDKINATTTGNCEPVIYLPPTFQQTTNDLSQEMYEDDELKAVHSHNILKVYTKPQQKSNNNNNNSSSKVSGKESPPIFSSSNKKPDHVSILSPGVVLADNNFPQVQQFINSPNPENPHYVHYRSLYGKKAPEDLDDDEYHRLQHPQAQRAQLQQDYDQQDQDEQQQQQQEDVQGGGDEPHHRSNSSIVSPSHVLTSPIDFTSPQHHRHNNSHHIHFDEHVNVISSDTPFPESKGTDLHHPTPQRTSSKSILKNSSQRSLTSLALDDANSQNSNPNASSTKKTLIPVSSNLDLRDEIANFMKKTNSPMKDAYEEYVEKTSTLSPMKSPAASIVEENPQDTKRSHASDISSTHEEAQRKLWEKLNNRYSGDREGEYHMKIKIKNYLKEGVKEETQILNKYMEEIDDWK